MKQITIDYDTYQAELKAQFIAGQAHGSKIKRLKPLLDFAWDIGAVVRIQASSGLGLPQYRHEPLIDLTKDQIVKKIRDIMFNIGEFK